MKMTKSAFSIVLAFALSTLIALQSWAISKEMKALVDYETKSNATAERSSNMVFMEHYEIPLRLVESDVAERFDAGIRDSLIFTKNGEKYLRWVINPEDTKWYKEVEKFLKENNVSTQRKRHFEAYQTASRSYILVDPVSKAEFSAKVSTDVTGGNWTDKKQTYEDAWQIRMITDYVKEMSDKSPALKNIIFADEPAIFGLKKIDQGMVIREYGKLPNSSNYYVPGFSIMHDQTGRHLAKMNGSNDPAAFWNEHYNKPLARAIAEFFVLTGMSYDSPHSQNFLVELDKNKRPTGKIVMRDFGDTYLSEKFFNAAGKSDIPPRWELKNVFKSDFPVSVGILHGSKAPSWMDVVNNTRHANSYDQWGRDFSQEFHRELLIQTGVQIDPTMSMARRNDRYFSNRVPLETPQGMEFLHLVTTGKQRSHLLNNKCQLMFAQ